MMTEEIKQAIVRAGGNVDNLPDNLMTTLMQRLCDTLGVDTSDMTDKLTSSYLEQIVSEYAGGGGGGQSGLPFIITTADFTSNNISSERVPMPATVSVTIPEDAMVSSFYFLVKYNVYDSNMANIGTTDYFKVSGNPSEFVESNLSDGTKKVTVGSYNVSYSNANTKYFRYVSGTEKVYAFGIMPNARIENNVLYANSECKSLFFKGSTAGRINPYYLEGVDLRGSGVITLYTGALTGISELKKVWLSEKLVKLNSWVFYDCTGLEEVHFTSKTPPQITSSECFKNVPTTCKIYVPTGTLNVYKSASNYPTNFTYIEE